MWSGYNGKQQGDLAKLGDALVKIAGMDNPPKQFLAGSDAVTETRSALEARLEEIRAFEDLSNSTDGLSRSKHGERGHAGSIERTARESLSTQPTSTISRRRNRPRPLLAAERVAGSAGYSQSGLVGH
jgi:hypothetical protein